MHHDVRGTGRYPVVLGLARLVVEQGHGNDRTLGEQPSAGHPRGKRNHRDAQSGDHPRQPRSAWPGLGAWMVLGRFGDWIVRPLGIDSPIRRPFGSFVPVNRGDEPVAAARNGLHEARVVGGIAERRADLAHGVGKTTIEIDGGVFAPEARPHLVAGDEVAGVLEQER